MSTATLIWIVSGVGAMLFFLAGVLAARSRATATPDLGLGSPGDFEESKEDLERALEAERMNNANLRVQVARVGELEELARRNVRASTELSAARTSADELRAEGQRRQEQIRRLESERDRAAAELRAEGERRQEQIRRLESERDRAAAELRAEGERRQEQIRRLESERDRARDELRAESQRREQKIALLESERDRAQDELRAAARAGTDADALRAELEAVTKERHELGQRVDLLERRLVESEGLARDNEALRESLSEAERRAAEVTSLQRAEADRQDLSVELSVLRGRLEELEHLRAENEELRAATTERDSLKARIADMTQEVAALRAQGLSRARRPSAPIPPINGERCTEGTLQSLLNGIAASPGMRSAVLADELGLPIVGIGEHSGPLAAFGGFMDTIAAKTGAFLPMEGIQRVQVQDQHGATVSAFPLALDSSRIALVTLTVDSVPTTQQMTRLLRSAATMVQ